MLQHLVDKDYSFPITWLHGCRNSAVHAFKDQLETITEAKANVEKHIFYNDLTEEDKQEGILEGHLDINQLPSFSGQAGTKYYLCGPSLFIKKQYNDLVALGIDKDSILFEEFGPQLLNLN